MERDPVRQKGGVEQDLGLVGDALVLLSGGMDSATALALAASRHGSSRVEAVAFDYGQKHLIELAHAAAIAEFYGIKAFNIISISQQVFQNFGSTLIDEWAPVTDQTYEEMRNDLDRSNTYVPFRNGTMLALATALATSRRMKYLYYGAHAEDSRNWAYPDCTPEFNGAMANAIYVGSDHQVRLITPFQWMSKGQIVEMGIGLGVPYQLTMSCYRGMRPACGTCATCQERLAAFAWAGVPDPIQYDHGGE